MALSPRPLAPASPEVPVQHSSSDEKQGKHSSDGEMPPREVAGCLQGEKMGLGAALALGWPWEVKIRLMPTMESTFRLASPLKIVRCLAELLEK